MSIAACAQDSETRLAGFILGTNDIAKETRARQVPGRWPMIPWLMDTLAAARVYGIDVLDGVYNNIGDAEGFAKECEQGRDMGFDGKTLIHPNQIEPCNKAFTPSDEEVAQARKMIAAFDLPENKDKGVVRSTAAWSSVCTPRWRAARWRSPMRSRPAHDTAQPFCHGGAVVGLCNGRCHCAGGTLRAAYLSTNPAQAIRDASGELRGASIEMAQELARRNNTSLALIPLASPPAVIEAVAKGEADIGFVAYAPERVGTVEFSQVYMLVQQSFIVPEDSPLKVVGDIDASGLRIAGGKADSVTLYLARNMKRSTLVETDNTPADARRRFEAKEIDAYGANRQRLTAMLKDMPGFRMLPDNLFGVPQTVIVPKGKADVLGAINVFIDEVRTSGLLRDAIARSGVTGVDVAPVGYQPKL